MNATLKAILTAVKAVLMTGNRAHARRISLAVPQPGPTPVWDAPVMGRVAVCVCTILGGSWHWDGSLDGRVSGGRRGMGGPLGRTAGARASAAVVRASARASAAAAAAVKVWTRLDAA